MLILIILIGSENLCYTLDQSSVVQNRPNPNLTHRSLSSCWFRIG